MYSDDHQYANYTSDKLVKYFGLVQPNLHLHITSHFELILDVLLGFEYKNVRHYLGYTIDTLTYLALLELSLQLKTTHQTTTYNSDHCCLPLFQIHHS